jgi:hypothetical protein
MAAYVGTLYRTALDMICTIRCISRIDALAAGRCQDNAHGMAQKQRTVEVELEVDGEPYVWRVQRQRTWSSAAAGWRGMAIALHHTEGKREAVLEFPPAPVPRRGTPLIQFSASTPKADIQRRYGLTARKRPRPRIVEGGNPPSN